MYLNGIILIKFTNVLHATAKCLLHVTDKAATAGNFATTGAGSLSTNLLKADEKLNFTQIIKLNHETFYWSICTQITVPSITNKLILAECLAQQ